MPVAQRTKAPAFTITDVQGKPFSLAAQKGRVVLLDFWAIACGGCKLELPWYVGFDQQYRSKGLSLVGLDMYGETPDAVRAFAATHQMHYPVAIGTDAIGTLYHLGEMPLTVLIDKNGQIAVSHVGVVDPKAFETDIKILLAEQQVSSTALGILFPESAIADRQSLTVLIASGLSVHTLSRPRFALITPHPRKMTICFETISRLFTLVF